jgi:hypothetical protein
MSRKKVRQRRSSSRLVSPVSIQIALGDVAEIPTGTKQPTSALQRFRLLSGALLPWWRLTPTFVSAGSA